MRAPPRRGVPPLARIRWPLSGSPIGQPRDSVLCVPGRSEMAPPTGPRAVSSTLPSTPCSNKAQNSLVGAEKKHWKETVHCKRQLDQWVTRSHIPGPPISAPPRQQLFRGEDSAPSGGASAEEMHHVALVPLATEIRQHFLNNVQPETCCRRQRHRWST